MKTNLIVLLPFLILSGFFSSTILAAEVSKFGKTGVVIKMQSPGEFSSGDLVCFRKNSKKVACGKISKTKNKLAIVKVKKSSLEKIELGMEVGAKDGGEDHSASSDRMSFYAAAAYSPMSVFNNSIVEYIPDGSDPNLKNRWNSSAASPNLKASYFTLAAQFFGIHGGVQFPISNMIAPTFIEFNYDNADQTKYLSLSVTHKMFGAFGDYLFSFSDKMFDLSVGAGFGYISDTITFIAAQKKDGTSESNPVISGKSNLSLITLRIPALLHINLKPVQLIAGTTLMVGLSGTAKATGEVLDTSSPDPAIEFQDFNTALSHKKKTVGIDIFGGIGIAF